MRHLDHDPDSRRPALFLLVMPILLAALGAAGLPACGGGDEDEPADTGDASKELRMNPASGKPMLVYFAQPDCEECKAATALVEKLQKPHSDKIGFDRRDASTEPSRKQMQRFGVNSNKGLVLLGHEGWPRWVQKGHDQDGAKVQEQIKATLAAKPGEPEDYGK